MSTSPAASLALGASRGPTGTRPLGRIDVQVVQPLYTRGSPDAASGAASVAVEAVYDMVVARAKLDQVTGESSPKGGARCELQ